MVGGTAESDCSAGMASVRNFPLELLESIDLEGTIRKLLIEGYYELEKNCDTVIVS